MAKKNVTYEIGLSDKMSGGLDRLDQKSKKLDKSISNVGKLLLTGTIALGLKKVGTTVFNLGANMEQTEIAFGTFLGSAEKGRKVISELNQFANVTPFNNDEIIKSGRVLLAANIPAENLQNTLKSIGDVAAGSNVPINDLANIYAKAMNKGKLQAEELNQLAERGIPIIDVLAKKFNVTKQEVFDLGSKSKITSKDLEDAFNIMTKEGGIFFNLMKKQSESATGLLSTLQGKIELIGIQMGKKMLPSAKFLTKGMIGLADSLVKITKVPLSENLQKTRYELNAEFNVLQKGNITAEQRAELISEINSKYKDYLPNLLNEKSSLKDIEIAQNAANEALLKRIEIEAKREILEDAINKAAKANRKLFEAQIYREKQLAIAAENTGEVRKNAIRAAEGTARSIDKLQKRATQRQDELLKLQQSLGNLSIGIDSAGAIKGVGAVKNALDQSGITKITAAAPKIFNININNLVETFNVSSTTIKEGAIDVRKQIEQALAEALTDVQAVAG